MYKYILAAVLSLAVATPALADHRRNHNGPYIYNNYHVQQHRQHRHRNNDKWVVPLIGGVILGAVIIEASKPKETVVKEVIVQSPPVTVTKVIVCTEWKEIMTSDGRVYKERTCRDQ
jgi:hypothetical protein